MSKTVCAIYHSHSAAKNALVKLQERGYRPKDLSVLVSRGAFERNIDIDEKSKAPEGISIGAGIGGAIGATAVTLTVLGGLTVSGGAPLLAAGPILATFAGIGVGASAGGLLGGLIGLGIPEIEAKLVDEKLSKGHIMLGVPVKSKNERKLVQELLNTTDPNFVLVH